MTSDIDFVFETLKNFNRSQYIACLYLPEAYRADVATLWAFDAEIARIPRVVNDPTLGEIRIQWWKDLLNSGRNVNSGPLARRLMTVISTHQLPLESFHNYLDARIFDLYQDPMPDEGSLEGYFGETVSMLFQNSALVGGALRSTALAEASGHAGMALGIATMLGDIAKHRANGNVYVPLTLLKSEDLDRDAWIANEPNHKHLAVSSYLIKKAHVHLSNACASTAKLPSDVRKVFLPLCLVKPLLNKIDRAGLDNMSQQQSLSLLRQNWIYFCASLKKNGYE